MREKCQSQDSADNEEIVNNRNIYIFFYKIRLDIFSSKKYNYICCVFVTKIVICYIFL
jgi:hypothetical protein